MLSIFLFFLVGISVISLILAPIAKSVEITEKKEVRSNENEAERLLEELVTVRKEKQEIEYEKEKELAKLNEQVNHRHAFRVKFGQFPCKFTAYPSGLQARGEIMDMSATGMRLHTPHDLNFEPNMYVELTFSFHEQPYRLKGIPLRKKTYNPYRYEYGINFLHEHPKQLEELYRALWQEQRKRNRKTS